MIAVKIASLVLALIALLMTFKAKTVIEKLLKKEPTKERILRVKYVALALAVIAFLTVFIVGK